jgi:hypothetical protein
MQSKQNNQIKQSRQSKQSRKHMHTKQERRIRQSRQMKQSGGGGSCGDSHDYVFVLITHTHPLERVIVLLTLIP